MSIYFHSEEVDFKLDNPLNHSEWIAQSIVSENKVLGDLNFIFCSDDYLLSINKEYLNHDTYTDIVTFNYVNNNTIAGDLFISIDRIKENSIQLKVPFENELSRVMIHGVLHLIGYDDKKLEDAALIRAKEDFYLTLQPKN